MACSLSGAHAFSNRTDPSCRIHPWRRDQRPAYDDTQPFQRQATRALRSGPGSKEADLPREGTIKTRLLMVIVMIALASCGSSGPVHVRYPPMPTPHKVVMIR